VKQICEQCFTNFYGQTLNAITKKDVEDWLTTRLARTWVEAKGRKANVVSTETAAKELRTLKAVFNQAVEWEETDFLSPASKVKAPRNLNSKPVHWYSATELKLLFKDSRYAPIWRLMANTGIRRAEALQLEWRHVLWDKGVINVESTEQDRTKSGKWREIPLTAGAITALKELKLRTGTLTHVIPQMAGPSLSRCFRLDAAAHKLGGSLHSLRHSYAAHLVLDNVPLRKVQTLMGHASFTTTERYGHIGVDHLADKVKGVSH
jgi:integrase